MRRLRQYKIPISRLLCAFCCIASLMVPAASADTGKEYYVKAAFLFNFAKFVDWPQQQLDGEVLRVCIAGENPFGDAIHILEKERANNRQLIVIENPTASEREHCNILFISASQAKAVPALLKSLHGKPVLTVSEIPEFIDHGGMVGFVMRDGRVKLEMHYTAAAEAGLDIDPTLFEVAIRVLR